ncbi:MAG: DUF4145 domain-containing protein [Candidatus Paracaedibacter sp.]
MQKKYNFIIDCNVCNAKVAAIGKGRAEHSYYVEGPDEPEVLRIDLGQCPQCDTLLVGKSKQIDFAGYNADEDAWSNIIRVYPKPQKTFVSTRIPKIVTSSLLEAEKAIQYDAKIAACVMLGRTLEAICRNVIEERSQMHSNEVENKNKGQISLHNGINVLRKMKIIDERLYEWSLHLKAFRNLAAHAEDIKLSRFDVQDLLIFVYAIIEYIYDFSELYEEFMSRSVNRKT